MMDALLLDEVLNETREFQNSPSCCIGNMLIGTLKVTVFDTITAARVLRKPAAGFCRFWGLLDKLGAEFETPFYALHSLGSTAKMANPNVAVKEANMWWKEGETIGEEEAWRRQFWFEGGWRTGKQ
jgi:hypothetical protein